MSLVKFDEKNSRSTWSNRNKKSVQHKLPRDVKQPVIDYKKLEELCKLDGLKNRPNGETSKEAHDLFMANYTSIFAPEKQRIGLPIHTENRSIQRESLSNITAKSVGGYTPEDKKASTVKEYPVDILTHDIRDYLPLLHKQRKSEKPAAVRADGLKTLRRLLKKLPFERSATENDQLYQCLRYFPTLADKVEDNVLKELCVSATLDVWKDEDITLFGNTGFHMILRGAVRPLTLPCFKAIGQNIKFRSPTPEASDSFDELTVGDCFGTLEKVEGRDANSRILTVMTSEPNCEFLKISTSDYARVIEQIRQRDETEKVNLLQSCSTYKLWSRQPLIKVASLLRWVSFPANTVLVSEGYKSPFVAIIKSGECHVLRQVEVLETLPTGKKEKKSKQVVMGKLSQSESFGEISVILDEPITCSIVTSLPVELGVIEPEQLEEIDEVTLQLLQQSSNRTYGGLSKDDIHDEYIKQELKREWNEFKHSVVVDVINARGIRPGYGKWAK